METITLRLAGYALVIGPDGPGPVVRSPALAVDALLRNEVVRTPGRQAFRGRVRRLLAMRAVAGQGPDGQGVNWAATDAA
ncbi:MAG TPA: hypothetical protein PL105_06875 [Caldilineaceae bacterium]|nr:hypothetical protein [Caldilineaceae bacterium]